MTTATRQGLGRAFVVYGVALIVLTWPLVRHPLSLLASTEGPGDSYLNLWILGWDLQTLTTHPGALFSGQIFNAPIFHPTSGTLLFSDHLLLQALLVAPVYVLTHDLALCYNLLFAGSLLACALAMHLYIRELTGSSAGALAAGLAWGFAPFHFGHITHLQLQALYGLPVAFLFLHRLLGSWRVEDAAWLGVTLGVEALSSVYYGIIGLIGVLAAAAVGLAGRTPRPPIAVVLRRGLLTAALAAVLITPVAFQYWRVAQREGFGRSLYEAAHGSAAPTAYLQAPPTNLLYGHWHPVRLAAPGVNPAEQYLFPGFTLLTLAGIGLFDSVRRRDRRWWALASVFVGGVGLAISLGPDRTRPLYALLVQMIFGFHAIRAPARFAVLALFGLATLAAAGVQWLGARTGRFAAAVAIGLVALEFANTLPVAYVGAPRLDTAVGQWLQNVPGTGAVLYWPLVLDPGENTTVMLQALQHRRPIVNGFSGQRPAYFQALTETLNRFPDAESLSALHALGVRFVVTRQPVDPHDLPLAERARAADGVIYEIDWSPDVEAKLLAADMYTLPVVDRVPFTRGETARYSLVWATGPLAIPAGEASLQVEAPDDGHAGYLLTARGVTAPWLSRFFQADDRLSSRVDGRLWTLSAEEHFHEGHRTLDRVMAFDRPARQVHIRQGSGAEVSLPIQGEALDPVAALYYLRALPFAPGSSARLAFNDAGRNLTVDVRSVGVEPIQHGGVAAHALRLDADIRDPGRQPIGYDVTIWRSLDASRVPLAMEVRHLAGVGTVRLELVQFAADMGSPAPGGH